ncbi:MAG: hypothetical protein ABSA16_13075 [Thermoguttaceae bacterium]|jgi:hypothetical protein
MKNKKNKTFDCIAIKRAAQEKIREEVCGMTPAEEVAYFRKGAEDFERRILAAKQQQSDNSDSAEQS